MYDFYIGSVQLPIAPSKLTVKIGNKNRTVSLINDGEVNILKGPGLTDINFTVLLPNVRYPFAVYSSGFQRADYYLTVLNALKADRMPFQFIVSRFTPSDQRLFDTDIRVSIEDYSIIENAGNGIDVYVDIKLKQYRTFGTKTIVLEAEAEAAPVATAAVVASASATVVETRVTNGTPAPIGPPMPIIVEEGDTLWTIAKKIYGDGSKYEKIYADNKGQLDNINAIKVGQILMLTK